MNPKLNRVVYTTLTCIIVFILLVSNLGYNFKSDVFSYKDIIISIDTLKANYSSSYNAEEYNNMSSKYISSKLKEYSIKPLKFDNKSSYLHPYSINLPYENARSYIEVISKYDNVIREYSHRNEFIEDISGLFSSKYVKGYGKVSNNIEFDDYVPNILLLRNYKTESNYNSTNLDEKLKALGVNAVIYPESKEKILDENLFYDFNYIPTNKGILKFAVTDEVYNELSEFVEKGYRLRLKSGVKIKEQQLYNVYGMIEGSNKKNPPLIIASFYDGEIPSKFKSNHRDSFEKSTYTPSMLLECSRVIKFQENINPDRTIIFAFLSGKAIDKKGLEIFRELNINGDFLLLDNLGNSNKFNLSIHENFKNFSNTLTYFMNKNDFKIISNTFDGYIPEKSAYITGINNYLTGLDFNNSYHTCKFILSLIGDECFNLDFLTAISRETRSIKRFIKDYTIPISAISLFFITYIVFKYPEIKNIN